jgi:perosamine synthetase
MLAIDGGAPVRTRPMPSRSLFGEEEKAAAVKMFDRCIETGGVIGYGGEEESSYEQEFAHYMGGGYADGVNSGTSAVYCALGALRLRPGSEVVCPPITDPGGCMPVALLGCIPVVADAVPGSYNTGAAQIEAVLTPHTSAILVAHIAGEPVDMDPIMELANKHGLPVIEDCAQAHGARYKGKVVGSIGTIAAVSTMSGKHHASGAQGGMVFSKDAALITECKRFSDRGKPFGVKDARTFPPPNMRAGLNLNSNDLSAAIGRVQLRKLEASIQRRRRVAAGISQGLCEGGVMGIRLGEWPSGSEPSHWFLRVHCDPGALGGRPAKDIALALKAEGIPCQPEYRYIVSEMQWFRDKCESNTAS